MRSWRVVRYGTPSEALRLEELPSPSPGPNQVRLRVLKASANFNDVDACYGRYLTVHRQVGERVQQRLDQLFEQKRIRPIVGERLAFEELPRALELLESRATIGRLVLSW